MRHPLCYKQWKITLKKNNPKKQQVPQWKCYFCYLQNVLHWVCGAAGGRHPLLWGTSYWGPLPGTYCFLCQPFTPHTPHGLLQPRPERTSMVNKLFCFHLLVGNSYNPPKKCTYAKKSSHAFTLHTHFFICKMASSSYVLLSSQLLLLLLLLLLYFIN